jgi:hypothetical protein
MARKDPEADRQYHRQWYLAHRDSELEKSKQREQWTKSHKEVHRASQTKYKHAQRDLINDLKKTGTCIYCGVADWRVLDFHHIDPSQKKINLNMAWKQNIGRQAILDEIAKCELVCANCHRILHWEERNGA